MKTLLLIPARGGSKGIPNKNITLLSSKPLIGYTIEECMKVKSALDAEICVSTDSEEIKKTSESFGLEVPFLRPDYLSKDDSTSEDMIIHALNWYENKGKKFDMVVLLQPTSPFRKAIHIFESIDLYIKNIEISIDMVVGVKKSKANPYFNLFKETPEGYLIKAIENTYTRRQESPEIFQYNGAIYVINPKSIITKGFNKFNKIQKYIMNDIDSIDIDDPEDLLYCEFVMKNKG